MISTIRSGKRARDRSGRADRIGLDEDNAPDVIADRSERELLEHRRAHYASPAFSHDFTALRRHWLETLFVEVGRSKSMAREAFDVFWQARNDVTPFEDAMAAIARLNAEGLFIGTITNGNASIEHIGLESTFTVTAADAGVMKPAAEIFAYAPNKVGVQPKPFTSAMTLSPTWWCSRFWNEDRVGESAEKIVG